MSHDLLILVRGEKAQGCSSAKLYSTDHLPGVQPAMLGVTYIIENHLSLHMIDNAKGINRCSAYEAEERLTMSKERV